MPEETDICIIGGGIMGAATAYSLSQTTKKQVLLLDRYGIGNDYCSSNDINRVFRYAYGNDQFYTQMAVDSQRLWKELERETGQELLVPTGLLMLEGEDENSNRFGEASYKTLNQMGHEARLYERSELEAKYPQFRAERGFYDPHGGVLLASKSLEAFASQSRKNGVRQLDKQVTVIRDKSSLEIETSVGQTIRSEKVVITAGPWTNSFLREGLTGMIPTRQQVVYIKPDHIGRFKPNSCPVFFTDHHYGLPAAGIDAVKISNKELSEPVDPETTNRTVDPEQIEQCKLACRKFIPDLATGAVHGSRVCLYDMTENSDFVLDADPDNPGIIFGYGFSGHGFKFAPLIGQLLAQLALEQEPSLDLSRFTIKRLERKKRWTSGQLGKGE